MRNGGQKCTKASILCQILALVVIIATIANAIDNNTKMKYLKAITEEKKNKNCWLTCIPTYSTNAFRSGTL
jgi:hypothetical protein